MQRNTYATKQLKTLLDCSPLAASAAIKLIEHGADPDTKDNYGNTLLHMLVSNFTQNYDIIKILVNTYHADINIANNNSHTPLQRLLNRSSNTEDAMKLVRLGADPTVIDEDGHDLLYVLTNDKKNTDPKVIEELIDLSMKYSAKTEKAKDNAKNDNKAKQFIHNLFHPIKHPTQTDLEAKAKHENEKKPTEAKPVEAKEEAVKPISSSPARNS